MSLLAKKKKIIKDAALFGAVTALRLGGKSTLGGTMPGKTAMFTAQAFETGDRSAIALANRLGNDLEVYEFSSAKELLDMVKEVCAKDSGFDNVYIDGLSGLTEMVYRTKEVADLVRGKSTKWDGFGLLGDTVEDVVLTVKKVCGEAGVHAFFTVALAEKYDSGGNLIALEVEAKGNSVLKNMRKIFPVVVCLRPQFDEETGAQLNEPEMVTKSDGVHPARIDSLLADENPGVIPADLSQLFALIRGA